MTAADTIAAIATAPGRGGVGILRLSGPEAHTIAARLAPGTPPPPRQASYRRFVDQQGEAVDDGLLLLFAAPNSYTGEQVAELQGHGSPQVLKLLLAAALAGGARAARPGEFTERAYLNGRLDLAQAEAVADLIDAATGDAARAARRALDGALSQEVDSLQAELTRLRVFLEGALDFSDEDVDWLSDEGFRQQLDRLNRHFSELTAAAERGRRLRDGLTVAIVGQPNVGKSSLLNAICRQDAAIVTDIAGTTRDLLRESIDLDGLPVTLIDTAGLRDTQDPVEAEGVRRAHAALQSADLVWFLFDATIGLDPADRELLASVPTACPCWKIANKADLNPTAETGDGLLISARSGAGLDELQRRLQEFAGVSEGTATFSARQRHVDALRRAAEHLDTAHRCLLDGATPELAAEDLRAAQAALGEITGAMNADQLLGAIFSSFCIGK